MRAMAPVAVPVNRWAVGGATRCCGGEVRAAFGSWDENSLERDSGRPWEFLGALMTPRGPIGREQAGSPAGHPDGALGGCPSQVRAILTGRPRQDRPPTKVVPAQQHRRTVPARTHPTHVSAPLVVNLAVSGCASHGRFRSCAGRGCSRRSRLKTDLLHAIYGPAAPSRPITADKLWVWL